MFKNNNNTKLSFIESVLNVGNIVLVTISYLISTLLCSKERNVFDSNQLYLLLLSCSICIFHFCSNIENRSLLRFERTIKNLLKTVIFSLTLWIILV